MTVRLAIGEGAGVRFMGGCQSTHPPQAPAMGYGNSKRLGPGKFRFAACLRMAAWSRAARLNAIAQPARWLPRVAIGARAGLSQGDAFFAQHAQAALQGVTDYKVLFERSLAFLVGRGPRAGRQRSTWSSGRFCEPRWPTGGRC